MGFKKKNEEEIKGKVNSEITFNDEMVIEDKPIILEIEDDVLKSPIVEEISTDIEEEVVVENKDSKIADVSKDEMIANLGKNDYNFYRRTGIIINRKK